VLVEASKVDNQKAKTDAEALLALARAESEEAGTQLDIYKTELDALKAESIRETVSGTGTV
jgi:hypothetical protein